jgi:plasmid stability protein
MDSESSHLATITVKNVPKELLERLRARAKEERRSVAQQILRILEAALTEGQIAERRARQLEAWRGLAGRWRSDKPLQQEIAEIYAARTSGRDVDL